MPDYPSLLRHDGAVHVVFGAGQGIGRQAAHAMSQPGSHVVCVDNVSSRARPVASEVGGTAVTADIRDEEQVVSALDRAHSVRKGLDGIVVVGMTRFVGLTDATEQDWAFHFGIVFDHARRLVKHGAEPLGRTPGTLTFVSSVAAVTGVQRNGPTPRQRPLSAAWCRPLPWSSPREASVPTASRPASSPRRA